MSLYGRDFVRRASELLSTPEHPHCDLHFVEGGYLFLASTEAGRQQMIENHAVQRDAGVTDVRLLAPDELRRQFGVK